MFTEQQNKDFGVAESRYLDKYSDLWVEYDEDEGEDDEWVFDKDWHCDEY